MRFRVLALSLSLAWVLSPPPTAADSPTAQAADVDQLAHSPSTEEEPHVDRPRDDDKPQTAATTSDQPTPAGQLISVPKEPTATQWLQPVAKHGRQTALEEAAESYRRSGTAPIVQRPEGIVFPFGEAQPIVTCSPLRACDIELQEGEVVRDVALGDSERWIAKPLMSGEVESTVPHVVVKPKDYNLATNLVIGTTRRTYHLALVSLAEGEAPDLGAYNHYISFYYPEELVESWASQEELRRLEVERPVSASVQEVAAFSVDDLNFAYAIEPGRKVPWVPQTVFDDGEHVYIQLPASVRSSDLPALLVEIEGGGLGLPNYRVNDLWYIVDGLFKRAELVAGVGKSRRKIAIRSLSWQSGG